MKYLKKHINYKITMKKVLLLTGLVLLASCSSPMSKKFDPNTYGSDIAEIEKQSKQDKELIADWVISHSIIGKSLELNGLTYEQILEKAKQEKKEMQQKLDSFYKTKYTNGDKFAEDLQKVIDEKIIKTDENEAHCLFFFTGYKEKEGTVYNMTYQQIFKESPGFCKEKESQ